MDKAEQPTITQADREAAEAVYPAFLASLKGEDGGYGLAEAFARHRTTSLAAQDGLVAEIERQEGLVKTYRGAQLRAEEKLCREQANAQGWKRRAEILESKLAALSAIKDCNTMTDMREQARDILNAHCEYMGGMDAGQAFIRTENALKAVEAALSLMQPEIDRRVAEERERLLERLRDLAAGPAAWLDSWAMHTGNCNGGYVCTCGLTLARTEAEQLLAQFEKENSHGQ